MTDSYHCARKEIEIWFRNVHQYRMTETRRQEPMYFYQMNEVLKNQRIQYKIVGPKSIVPSFVKKFDCQHALFGKLLACPTKVRSDISKEHSRRHDVKLFLRLYYFLPYLETGSVKSLL